MITDPRLRQKETERKRLIEYLSNPDDCFNEQSRRQMKGLRFFLGMTQNEFAEFAHLRLGTLRAWESGKQSAPEHFFYLTAKLLVMSKIATEEEILSVLDPEKFKEMLKKREGE